MLDVGGLHACYGRAHILRDVSFTVGSGEVLVLAGRNGAGKSTTIKAVMGLVRPRRGSVRLRGRELAGVLPFRAARAGLGYVPEERRVFAELTVAENLLVGRRPARPGLVPWTEERAYALFPSLRSLRDRPAGRTSGGEQQMLAVARTLMGNPRVLLLDEPSEGLAPAVVAQMADAVCAVKAAGMGVLLAEQNLRFAERVGDRAVVLERGAIAWAGTMAELGAVRERFLGV